MKIALIILLSLNLAGATASVAADLAVVAFGFLLVALITSWTLAQYVKPRRWIRIDRPHAEPGVGAIRKAESHPPDRLAA